MSKSPTRALAGRILSMFLGLTLLAWGYVWYEQAYRRAPLRQEWRSEIEAMRAAGEPVAVTDFPTWTQDGAIELVDWLGQLPSEDSAAQKVASAGIAMPSPQFAATVGALTTLGQVNDSAILPILDSIRLELNAGKSMLDLQAESPELLAPWRVLRTVYGDYLRPIADLDLLGGVDVREWLRRSGPGRSGSPLSVGSLQSVFAVLLLETLLASADQDLAGLELGLKRQINLAKACSLAPLLIGNMHAQQIVQDLCWIFSLTLPQLSTEFLHETAAPSLLALAPRPRMQHCVASETTLMLAWFQFVAIGQRFLTAGEGQDLAKVGDGFESDQLALALVGIRAGRALAVAVGQPFSQGSTIFGKELAAAGAGARARGQTYLGSDAWDASAISSLARSYKLACKQEFELACLQRRIELRLATPTSQGSPSNWVDPFDGLPLRQRGLPSGGLFVWSVGENGIDESSSLEGDRLGGDDLGASLKVDH